MVLVELHGVEAPLIEELDHVERCPIAAAHLGPVARVRVDVIQSEDGVGHGTPRPAAGIGRFFERNPTRFRDAEQVPKRSVARRRRLVQLRRVLTAETIARSEADTIDSCMPTPQVVSRPPVSIST